jgi:hypothetical protein
MDFFKSEQTIILFVLLFMPGFISTRVFDALVPGERRDYGKAIYETVGYSMLTYALWSPVLFWLLSATGLTVGFQGFLVVMILLVTPAALPVLYLVIIREFFPSAIIDPCPTAWDWAFAKNPSALVLLHLRDGRHIGGLWAGNAYASSYPINQDVYLSEVWHIDQDNGEFISRVQDSRGLHIDAKDVEIVEFFDADRIGSKANERQQARATQPE